MTPKHRWDKNSNYRKWALQRDRALEALHTRAQLEASDEIRKLLTHVVLTARAQFHGLNQGLPLTVQWFENGIAPYFNRLSSALYRIATDLRARSYTLARASESEIIAQLSKKPTAATVHKARVTEVKHNSKLPGPKLAHRITLYCDRMRRKITSYAQTAALHAKDPDELARDVFAIFPKPRAVKVPRRILKPKLMEAEIGRKLKTDVAIDLVDEDTWNDMRDAYMDEYVPKTRAPEFIVGAPATSESETWYAWEFERDLTNEFVQSVREGTIDAANENGITDFVWIAIIDDRTDECCLWRDGLLVSEIEAQLADHEGEDEDCNIEDGEGLTPPIHFNCRCTLAPATDNIPEKPDDGAKDFEEWLNS